MPRFLTAVSLTPIQFCLLGTSACLIGVHLTLLSRTTQSSLFGNSLLFWAAVVSLAWSKRYTLKLTSGWLSTLLGVLLISLVLLRSMAIADYDPFLRVIPILSTLGIALLASGFRNLKQYWQEFLILSFLVPSPGVLASFVDISLQTAQFSAYILWHLGFPVSRDGVFINLPEGGVEVYPGCSGIESMFQLVGLAVLFILLFPTTRTQKVLLPITAMAIAFIVNGVRVALMAFLAAYSTSEKLEYWHVGQGSLIFSMISVSVLGLLCLFLLNYSFDEEDETAET